MHYIDTSALVKLVVDEANSDALRAWAIEHNDALVSCDLTRTELQRAVRRTHPDLAVVARQTLDAIALLTLTAADFDNAGRIGPDDLRSLDAIHLAAALSLGDDLESLVTYDDRLAAAAERNGIAVVTPR